MEHPDSYREVARRNPFSQKTYRGMEQLVARRAHNPKVTGSSPVPATTKGTNRYPFLFSIITIHRFDPDSYRDCSRYYEAGQK